MGGWQDDDPIEDLMRGVIRMQRLRRIALVSVIALALFGLVRLPPIARLWRGEVDLAGDRAFVPPYPVDPQKLHDIDHARVHAQLWPAWVIAVGREARSLDDDGEADAFAALRGAVEPDPNLTELLDELRALLRDRAAFEADPRRALYLAWAWSQYLDDNEIPYLVQATVAGTQWGPMLSVMVYSTVGDAVVWVGTDRHRVRLGSRIDGTNARELYLGAAGHEEAIVVTDRLEEFAFSELWPLLAEKNDAMLGERQPFAAAVRSEAQRRLDPADFELLGRTAYWRWQIVTTVESIHARRTCGSRFRIHSVPWFGFEPERIDRLRAYALASSARACPAITPEEIELLEVASGKLQSTQDLGHAVGALVAWAAEHVAVHEARHLADDALADGFDAPLPCASCSTHMGIEARAELSGYLASMAWSPSGATAMYQACRSLADESRQRGGELLDGPHAQAMDLLTRRIGPFCRKGPPPRVAAVARELEAEMLGRSDPIRLGDAFPRRLPVE